MQQTTVKSINWIITHIIVLLFCQCGLSVSDLSMTTGHTTINTMKHLSLISLSNGMLKWGLYYFKQGIA